MVTVMGSLNIDRKLNEILVVLLLIFCIYSGAILLSHNRRDSPEPRVTGVIATVSTASYRHQWPPRVIGTSRSSDLPVAHQIHYRQPIARDSPMPQSPRVLLHESRESSPPVAAASHRHQSPPRVIATSCISDSLPPVAVVIHCRQLHSQSRAILLCHSHRESSSTSHESHRHQWPPQVIATNPRRESSPPAAAVIHCRQSQ
ncbi:Uncharacterized protein Fot_04558 [Forsythia ovata]|uniref:Uncharacterized protein n=1 Tax=Forsythia ovata TaxID=205694 RepID=A0ABD1XD19_9LAMI